MTLTLKAPELYKSVNMILNANMLTYRGAKIISMKQVVNGNENYYLLETISGFHKILVSDIVTVEGKGMIHFNDIIEVKM